MKTTLFNLVFLLLIVSCEKDIQPEPARTTCPYYGQRETRVPMPGVYEGIMTITIPGYVDSNTVYTRRTITYITNDSEINIKWCDIPDTFAIAQPGKNFHYTMTLKFSSLSCGQQDAIFDYYPIVTCIYDSLFEAGNVRYRWYYEGELRQDFTGRFTAKLKRL